MAKHMILILGNYGSGKTVSAATIAGVCEGKVKYIALDEKLHSIYTTKNESGHNIISEEMIEKLDIVKLSDKNPDEHPRRPVMQSPKKDIAAPAGKYVAKAYENFNILYDHIDEVYGNEEYEALVIDSLTELCRIHSGCVKNANNTGTLRLHDYGTLWEGLRDAIIPTFENAPVNYMIIIGHLAYMNEDKTEKLVNVPITNSQTQSLYVPSRFGEVYIQVRDKKIPSWFASPKGLWTGSSKLNVPEIVTPADFRQIKTYLI